MPEEVQAVRGKAATGCLTQREIPLERLAAKGDLRRKKMENDMWFRLVVWGFDPLVAVWAWWEATPSKPPKPGGKLTALASCEHRRLQAQVNTWTSPYRQIHRQRERERESELFACVSQIILAGANQKLCT